MGTRSKHNPVKALSAGKADQEGDISAVLSDELFRIRLDGRLHRFAESQGDSVVALLGSVQECRWEASSWAIILTADRGYVKPSFVDVITDIGFSSILIIPEQLLSTHPFLGESHMDTARDDLLEGEFSTDRIGTTDCGGNGENNNNDDGDEHLDIIAKAVIRTGLTADKMVRGALRNNARLANFVIPDAGHLGMSFFRVKRRAATTRSTRSRTSVVREPTEGAVENIVRHQYDLPDLLAQHALT